MKDDLSKTTHYTTQANYICSNLLKYVPQNVILVEPFVGEGDLIKLFPFHKWETYDVVDKGFNTIQDTLKSPPDYKGKWVITNPPYLAKNKATDKSIFSLYDTDDLYKASLLSFLDCAGGILIIPTNFFTDERSGRVRKKFLDIFQILEANVFTRPAFTSTTYSVSSFSFQRRTECEAQRFNVNIQPNNKTVQVQLSPQYDYRLAGEYYAQINQINNMFGRAIKGQQIDGFITNLNLYALDSREKRIRIEYDSNHYYGKQSDRTMATLTCKRKLTDIEQKWLVEAFNKELETFRQTYADLPMTNYRDFNRKRIGFDFVYQMLTHLLDIHDKL